MEEIKAQHSEINLCSISLPLSESAKKSSLTHIYRSRMIEDLVSLIKVLNKLHENRLHVSVRGSFDTRAKV